MAEMVKRQVAIEGSEIKKAIASIVAEEISSKKQQWQKEISRAIAPEIRKAIQAGMRKNKMEVAIAPIITRVTRREPGNEAEYIKASPVEIARAIAPRQCKSKIG